MSYKRGLTRIYTILSALWVFFWLFIAFIDKSLGSALFGIISPFVVYLVIVWIIKGFKE